MIPDPQIADDQAANAIERLEERYARPDMTPDHPVREVHVDVLGYGRWVSSYVVKRQNGMPHEAAIQGVLAEIEAIEHPHEPPPPGSLPPPPTRDQLLRGPIRVQGRMVNLDRFGGAMPWWGACWLWLTPEERASVAAQLLQAGDRICLIQVADGEILYNEPNQFYAPDRFGPLRLDWPTHVAAIQEALQFGYPAIWLFLGGDAGNEGTGFPKALEQVRVLGAALGAARADVDLRDYCVVIPGWDGVWHAPSGGGTGYTREQLRQFAEAAHAAGFKCVGVEHGTGYMLAGKGQEDYAPGGVMHGYQLILGEFDDDRWDDTVWQILARSIPTYVRPPDEPAGDDTRPPHDLAGPSSDGLPPVYRVFEFYIYGGVRGASPDLIQRARVRFETMGAVDVC